jgi:hypothetical protein
MLCMVFECSASTTLHRVRPQLADSRRRPELEIPFTTLLMATSVALIHARSGLSNAPLPSTTSTGQCNLSRQFLLTERRR